VPFAVAAALFGVGWGSLRVLAGTGPILIAVTTVLASRLR
jgi:hypothetical protein